MEDLGLNKAWEVVVPNHNKYMYILTYNLLAYLANISFTYFKSYANW